MEVEYDLKSQRVVRRGPRVPIEPTYVIAEVGSNWSTLEDCMTSISLAKACGADAVKFQAFDHAALYGQPDPGGIGGMVTCGYTLDGKWVSVANTSVKKSALPLDWLPKLKEKADACGIDFMCTAFSPELVAAVDPFVKAHKVASAEMTHVRLLEAVRKTGKPVYLSTGGHGMNDIARAYAALTHIAPAVPKLTLMYCVASYPAREVDLGAIGILRDAFGVPIGYSDHSTDVLEIPRRAQELGAVAIEKHVQFVPGSFPDSPHSLDTDQFKHMVRALRGKHESRLGPTMEESGMVLRHNRRLIATRDIPVGGVCTEGHNFGAYRSLKDDTHAYSPWLVDSINGKVAKREIKAGDGIGPGDV